MAIFSKVLTKTDIEKRLSVPSKHLKHLPNFKGGHEVNFLVRDQSGKVWPLQCSIRKHKYMKPVLSRGWLEFVRRSEVKVNDKIKFCVESGGQYRIQVEKPVKIFGAIIGYVPTRG